MPVVLFKTTVSEKLSSSVSSPTRLIHSAIVCLKKVIKVFDLFFHEPFKRAHQDKPLNDALQDLKHKKNV